MTPNPARILLDIVDMQNDFILAEGACTHPEGRGLPLVPRFNAFLRKLTAQDVDVVLIKYDTHFLGEYPYSPEAKIFPNPHCVWNSKGQEMTVELGDLEARLPVFHMNKNEFSPWGANPTDIRRVLFSNAEERAAYRNLFRVTPRFNDLAPGVLRDEWLERQGVIEAVVAGIYADYCTADAIEGYLERGLQVTALTDLTTGIGGNPERSGADLSGDIEPVCAQRFASALKSGQLRLMTSAQWLTERRDTKPRTVCHASYA